MDLILKPTVRCNFKCTFCSSTHLGDSPSDTLDLSYVERFLDRFPDTRTIIINGGDPLMMSPAYYWAIIDLLDQRGSEATLSLTTNLWPFYKKPELWVELFNHPRVGISTSFQYGEGRLKGDLTPFTEAEFWAVSDTMLELVGYRPSFIAVVDKSNEHTVMDTVRLAQQMGVEAKVNRVYSSGPEVTYKGVTLGAANNFYLLADIYEHYLAIHAAGLTEWEYNTKQMTQALVGGNTTCPLARKCDEHIRNLQPSGDYYSCGSFGDDGLYSIDFEEEMTGGLATPLQEAYTLDTMKASCYTCPMFNICNGCRKTVHDTKQAGMVEPHCRKMKTLAPAIIAANGLTDVLEPTPYVEETPSLIIARG